MKSCSPARRQTGGELIDMIVGVVATRKAKPGRYGIQAKATAWPNLRPRSWALLSVCFRWGTTEVTSAFVAQLKPEQVLYSRYVYG